MCDMTTRRTTSHLVLTVLPMLYGAAVAILGATGSAATGLVAMIGALILGLLWALRSMVSKRTPTG